MIVVVVVVVDCYCFLLNIIVEPLLSGPSHLASAKCMICSKPIVWPQPNDGRPGHPRCCCNLAGIHLGCKKSYVSADSSFYLNKLMFSFFRTKIITFFVTKQLCFIVQIIHQASSSRAWCSVAQKHRFLSGGAALFSTGLVQPPKPSFYLSQIGVSDETYRFTSAKHTPVCCCCNRWLLLL